MRARTHARTHRAPTQDTPNNKHERPVQRSRLEARAGPGAPALKHGHETQPRRANDEDHGDDTVPVRVTAPRLPGEPPDARWNGEGDRHVSDDRRDYGRRARRRRCKHDKHACASSRTNEKQRTRRAATHTVQAIQKAKPTAPAEVCFLRLPQWHAGERERHAHAPRAAPSVGERPYPKRERVDEGRE